MIRIAHLTAALPRRNTNLGQAMPQPRRQEEVKIVDVGNSNGGVNRLLTATRRVFRKGFALDAARGRVVNAGRKNGLEAQN